MHIKKAYKFKLDPHPEDRMKLAKFAGCKRVVWNKALAIAKEALDKKEKVESYAGFCLMLTLWQREAETAFLKEAPTAIMQQGLKDLSKAMRDCFKKIRGFPNFKKKDIYDSFRYPENFKLNGNKVYLPKVGWVKFRKSQEIKGNADATATKIYATAYNLDVDFYEFFKTLETYKNTLDPSTLFILSTDNKYLKYIEK